MIRAIGCRKDDVLLLLLRGHAQFAKPGNDIICAAASALIYALAGTLEAMEIPSLRIRLDNGCAQISCQTESVLINSLFYQTLIGLAMLEKEYPKNIEVRTAGFFREDAVKEEIA